MTNFPVGELVNELDQKNKNKSEFKNKIEKTNQTTKKNIENILNRDSTIEREERPLKDNSGLFGINKKNYGELLTRNLYHVIFSDIEIKKFREEFKTLNLNTPEEKNQFMKEVMKTLKNYQEDYNISKKINIIDIVDIKTLEIIKKIQDTLQQKIFSIKKIIYQTDKAYEEQQKIIESSEIKIGEQFGGKVKNVNLEKSYLLINFGNKYIGSILFENTLEGQKGEKINTQRFSHNIDVIVTDIKKNKEGKHIYYLKEIEKKEQTLSSNVEKSSEKKEGESKPLLKKIIDYITSRQNAPHQPKPYIGISLDELYSKFKNDISGKENITDEKKIRAKIHSTLENHIRKNPETMKKDYFLPEGTYKNKEGNWELPEGEKPLLYYTIITKAIKKNKSP